MLFVAKNQVRAGQLQVMEALLESWTLHKSNEKVVEAVAFAVKNICTKGDLFVLIILISPRFAIADRSFTWSLIVSFLPFLSGLISLLSSSMLTLHAVLKALLL